MKNLTAHELFYSSLARARNAEVVSGNRRFTYEQIWERAVRAANGLARLGIGRGSVVGVMDVNSHRFLELHYALSMLGAVIHTINFRLAPADILYTLKHARDEWLLVWEGFSSIVGPLREQFPNWIWLTDSLTGTTDEDAGRTSDLTYEDLISEGGTTVPEEASRVTEADAYSIFYTTGTTGRPKGLMYRHRDLLLASLEIAHHLALHPTGAGLSSRDTVMPLIPFFHIHGWGAAFFAPYIGVKLVLPERSGVDEQLSLIRREGVTWSNMVPTQLHMLLSGTSSTLPLKVLTGGSQLPSGLARRAVESGVRFSLIYGGSDQLATGISELPAGIQDAESDRAIEVLSTRICPLSFVDIEIRDKAGHPVAKDAKSLGELWVRSPWLPDGYLYDAERSREVYQNGWFRSGDLAVAYPDGTFYVVDRERDAVKSGGEWIPTGVLEALLSEHPKVAIACVLAESHERWGERPLAVVQPHGEVTEDELLLFLRGFVEQGRIPRFWLPDRVVFVDSFPMTSAGKVHKAALRQALGL